MPATSRTTAIAMGLAMIGCASRDETTGAAPASGTVEVPTTPAVFEVASYNVFYDNAKRSDGNASAWAEPETLRVAGALDADVIVFQETNDAWQEALERALLEELPHCKFHAPVRYLPAGLGTCSRHPIVEDELIPSSVDWFPAQRVVVDTPDGKVQILNVHLKPAVAGSAEWWDIHRATRADRAKEMGALLAKTPRTMPTIVAGDFNDVIEGDVFTQLRAGGFDNAFAVSPTNETTWEWAGAEPPLAALLDHVAYDRAAFRLTSANVVRGGRSDHRAVVATFEVLQR